MIVAALAMLALTSMLTAAPAGETKEWVRGGCHLKGMALPQKMNETLQVMCRVRPCRPPHLLRMHVCVLSPLLVILICRKLENLVTFRPTLATLLAAAPAPPS